MPVYLMKEKTEILRHALQKLQKKTPVTSIGPGSVARGLAEVVVNEIGDFYNIMDFNTAMGVISTAQGRALDLIGQLYSVERKQLGEVATVEQTIGSFYFYIDEPHTSDITIPQGTTVFTDADNYIGQEYSYLTTTEVRIRAGRTRVFAAIRPEFSDSVFTAGEGTITQHNATAPEGVIIRCTNPKTIAPQIGFETDENYRNRIIKAVRTSAGGTTEALRFAGLGLSGVREVKMRNAPYGLGSVEALVVPEERSIATEVLVDAVAELERIRPAGVKLYVREPDYTPLDITATIVLRNNVSLDTAAIARRAEIGIMRYLNRLLPGKQFVYNQLIQAILESSDVVKDVSIQTLRASGTEILRRNYNPEDDQQIVPGDIEVTVATSAIN